MYQQVLFPTDGSDGAALAFGHAIEVARAYDATLHVLHVADTTRLDLLDLADTERIATRLERQGRLLVDEAAARVEPHGVDVVTTVARGDPPHEIVARAAADGADLIVIPTSRASGTDRPPPPETLGLSRRF